MKGSLVCAALTVAFVYSANAADDTFYFLEIPEPDTATVLEAAAVDRLNLEVSDDWLLQRHTDYNRLNEFERRRVREDYIGEVSSELDKRVNLSRANTAYVFSGALGIGEYEFERKTFPFLSFYRSMSGLGGRISIKRGEMDGKEWWYEPTKGVDPEGTPLGYFIDRNRHDVRYKFDWHPVFTSYLEEDPAAAEQFLDNFGRRPSAVLITSLEDISYESGADRMVSYSFSVECMVLPVVKGNSVYARSFNASDEPSAACEQYVQWRLNGVDPTDFFDVALEEVAQ